LLGDDCLKEDGIIIYLVSSESSCTHTPGFLLLHIGMLVFSLYYQMGLRTV